MFSKDFYFSFSKLRIVWKKIIVVILPHKKKNADLSKLKAFADNK